MGFHFCASATGGFLGGADHYEHTYGGGDARGGRVGGFCRGYDVRRCEGDVIETDWTATGNYSTTLWTSEIEKVISDHDRKK